MFCLSGNNTQPEIIHHRLSSVFGNPARQEKFWKRTGYETSPLPKKTTTNHERILLYLPSGLCFAADNCREDVRRYDPNLGRV